MDIKGCIKGLDQETSDIIVDRIRELANVYIEIMGPEVKRDNIPLYNAQFLSLVCSWLVKGTANDLCTLVNDERGVFIGMSATIDPGKERPSFNAVLYIYRPDYMENLVIAYLRGLAITRPDSLEYMGNRGAIPIFITCLNEGYGAMIGVTLDDSIYDEDRVFGSISVAEHTFDNLLFPSLPDEIQEKMKRSIV